MTHQEAVAWLRQVDGTVYRQQRECAPETAWVAVVRTPPSNGRVGKIILAFGDSLEGATIAAEEQWQDIWGRLSETH